MTENKIITEDKILKAARELFIKKGYNGTKMQEIADLASINKAGLHYYFRNKDNLYKAIFITNFNKILGNIQPLITKNQPIKELIEGLILNYMEIAEKDPDFISFIISEANLNSERVQEIIKEINLNFAREEVFKSIAKAVKDGKIRPIKPIHLVIDIVSLCFYPIVSHNIFKNLAQFNKEKEKKFNDERKEHVINFVLNSILINQ